MVPFKHRLMKQKHALMICIVVWVISVVTCSALTSKNTEKLYTEPDHHIFYNVTYFDERDSWENILFTKKTVSRQYSTVSEDDNWESWLSKNVLEVLIQDPYINYPDYFWIDFKGLITNNTNQQHNEFLNHLLFTL